MLGSCKAGKPRVRRDLCEGREAHRLRWGTREAQDTGKASGPARASGTARGREARARGGRLAASGAHCLWGSWQAGAPVRELAEGWVSQGLAAPGLAHGVGEQEQTLESSAALCKAGFGRGEVGSQGK